MRYWPCALFLSLMAAAASVECDVPPPPTRPFAQSGNGLASRTLGFPESIARALRRLRGSTGDYRLAEDLWFEKLPENVESDHGQSALKSTRSAGLMQLADTVFDTHRLTWRNAMVRGVNLNVYKDRTKRYRLYLNWRNENDSSHNQPATRTFGLGIHRRRMQFMLPVMYKLGVITTLLIGLTVMTLKGVTIGVVLLLLTFASIASKLHWSKSHHHHEDPLSYWSKHDPFDHSHSALNQLRDKHVHVHVHTGPGFDNNMMYSKSSPPTANGLLLEEMDGFKYDPSIEPAAHRYWNRNHQNLYDLNAVADQYYNSNNNHHDIIVDDNNYHYRRRKKKHPVYYNHKLSTIDDNIMVDNFVGESPTTNSVYQRLL